MDIRTTASTEDAIVRFRLPTAQSSKSEDIILALSERLLPASTVRMPEAIRRAEIAWILRTEAGHPPP